MLSRAGGVVAEDYLSRVLAGTTVAGGEVPGTSGIKARRRGRYKGARGAVMTPFGRQSRAYSGYRWRWQSSGNRHVFTDEIVGPAWIAYRVGFYNYGGISPKGRARLDGVLKDSVLKLIGSGRT